MINNDPARAELTAYLQVMLGDYWHDVDTNWGRNAAMFYTEDAVFHGSKSTYRGRSEIAAFYRWREERGARQAVHAFANLRVVQLSETEAESTWYLLLYAGDGPAPLQSGAPNLVALMTDSLVRQPDGNWLYASRRFSPIFESATGTTNPDASQLSR